MSETVPALDRSHLHRALELARRGRFRTAPNPMVGAVVVRDGVVVGEGHHARVGGPHAEVVALRHAGGEATDATLYVTLEPCAHHGRTPPCVQAILEAGISRVVVCHRDPNPDVAGRGLDLLEERGVEVEEGILLRDAVRLNWKYLVSKIVGRPAVTLKWAMTLDGKIATVAGESQWISSSEGRSWSLEQREVHDAILIGSGTALADDPRLTRRLGRAEGPILRGVLDRRLRLSAGAGLFREAGPVLVYSRGGASREKVEELEEAGGEVVHLSKVDPAGVLADLHDREVQSVLVEGGGEIHAAFVAAGAFDRVAVVCAPRILGGREAPGPVGGPGFPRLPEAPVLGDLDVRSVGPDLLIESFRERCLQELYESAAS
ncbi:MAG: bifunctional diaminohydroxyphosphoribosylaminopyrimidine deaminase/5-amino-6-(5-phosphoribosylamino)uracil reductase RibD [Thermoanaerobaculia bacterium]|nr:bifunctional diaminohydroxyphosphoribosylaminopyrimidine deaminase/5-amino-6-(5-phosphoribosylamino)uracil reductase RibD [Thermoanaerobaculia bacterium]